MMRLNWWAAAGVLFTVLAAFVFPFTSSAGASSDEPETVMVTYHPLAGNEAALLQVLREARSTLRRLDLVDESPYLLARAGGPDSVRFVEIFTWKNGEIPDHAPPDVRAQWDRMQKLVRPSGSHPGIEIELVQLLPEK